MPTNVRVLIPIRYSVWLSGDLGKQIEAEIARHIKGAKTTRLPRGILIEQEAATAGTALNRTEKAVREVEAIIAKFYPVFHREMGPVWAGTLQVLYATEADA